MDRSDGTPDETQEERAERALQAIFGGADLTTETTQLANEFTDRQTGRLTGWLRRRRPADRPADPAGTAGADRASGAAGAAGADRAHGAAESETPAHPAD